MMIPSSLLMLASANAVSSFVLWCVCLLFAILLLFVQRGWYIAALFVAAAAAAMCGFNAGVFTALPGWLAALGVAPHAGFAALLFVSLLLGHVTALCVSRDFVFRRSLWLGSLVAWLGLSYLLIYIVAASVLYDASGDNMLAELRKPSVAYTDAMRYETEYHLLDDAKLKSDELHAVAETKDIPAADFLSGMKADTAYQTAAPTLILQGKEAQKAEAFKPRPVKKPAPVAQGGGSARQLQDADALKGYITQLEKRKYIQDNSLRIRKILVPLLREIAAGADINTVAKNSEKRTALHYACAIGDCDVTAWLLKNHASQQLRDSNGDTPRQCIGANHSDEIRRLLDKAGKEGTK